MICCDTVPASETCLGETLPSLLFGQPEGPPSPGMSDLLLQSASSTPGSRRLIDTSIIPVSTPLSASGSPRQPEGFSRCDSCNSASGSRRKTLQSVGPRTRTPTNGPPLPPGVKCSVGDPYARIGTGECCAVCKMAVDAYTHQRDSNLEEGDYVNSTCVLEVHTWFPAH